MNLLQRWIENMTVIAREERDRWERMREVFAEPAFDLSVLETPACWRRKGSTHLLRRSV